MTAERGRGDTRQRADCFHCGERCDDLSFAKGEKVFCCQGCLVVHELLGDAGLEHFYALNRHPGVRVRRDSGQEQWSYLDEPALQQRLLDFTDGRISRVTLPVPAIHCVACVWLLENLFRLHPGIGRSQVNFTRREVSVEFRAGEIRLSELAALMTSIGYEPALTLDALEERKPDPRRRRQWIQLGIAGFAFGNIMLLSIPIYLGLDSLSGPFLQKLFGWLSLLLALPVMVYSASDYWWSARLALRQRALTLDVPIALGLAALFAQSAGEVFAGRGVGYLDSLVGLVFFLLCGRAFQQKTYDRLAFDRDYKSFFPLSVTRRSGAGDQSVSLSRLRVGDRVVLRHGELIPADGRLVRGPALVDYSFVTGEADPVEKAEGDYLYAGGRQVGGGIEIETVKPVSQSYLTSLWNHGVFQKDGGDTLNTLTNRYSRRFTQIVIAVALGAALVWMILGHPAQAARAFTSVLIVACPCALALAAPFTLGTAQRLLARRGVCLRNGLVLERMARVNAIVFDKTGTLTPAAGAVSFPGPPLDEAEQEQVAALARQSAHPHSARIHQWLAGPGVSAGVTSFREVPGQGVEGCVAGRKILLGAPSWLQSHGVNAPASASTGSAGGGTVHLAIDGRHRGVFQLRSSLRPGIDRLLRELGPRCALTLLSGDNEKERNTFSRFFAESSGMNFGQSPVDKLEFIRGLQRSGKVVMMVGDGLNDAGALKQSDVGIAVVETAGVFSPASDVILEGAQVSGLSAVLALARRATRIVRLSFAISALYNVVGVGIAAAGLLSPVICAVLMPLSSISVVLFACGATEWAARSLGPNLGARQPADSGVPQAALQPAC